MHQQMAAALDECDLAEIRAITESRPAAAPAPSGGPRPGR